MSAGHRIETEPKTIAQVFGALGTADTPEIYGQSYTIVTNRDIPYAGGNSVDRKRVYIDQELHRQVMAGEIKVEGLNPHDFIRAWCEHEHTEKSVDDGDNPFDDYLGSHGIAESKEDWFIEQRIGKDGVKRYNKAIQPFLDDCAKRFLRLGNKANPPTDLWCGPYLDDPTPEDEKILAILRAKGVTDASKASKSSAHYGMGGTECRDCKHFAPSISQDRGQLGDCEKICGLVRWDRACDWWTEKGKR